MSNRHPGTVIPVSINGAEVFTIIDDDGVQRLQSSPYLKELADSGLIEFNRLNDVACSRDAIRWLYQNIGYSLCGYQEIFPSDEIENPLWDEEETR